MAIKAEIIIKDTYEPRNYGGVTEQATYDRLSVNLETETIEDMVLLIEKLDIT